MNEPKLRATVFLASSTAAKAQARALASALATEYITFLPWWDSFTPGQTLLSELQSIRKRVQACLLVLSPDHPATIRTREVQFPNQNVLFEFGFFFGSLPPACVAVVRYGQTYLPSDLDGYIHISGSKSFRPSKASAPTKRTRSEFERWSTSSAFTAGVAAQFPRRSVSGIF